MFVTDKIPIIPGKTLVEDLLTRVGEGNKDSLSPFTGKKLYIRKKLKDETMAPLIIKKMCEKEEFTFYAQGCQTGPYPEDEGEIIGRQEQWLPSSTYPPGYLRRLEELDESWLEKWLDHIYGNVLRDRLGGVRDLSAAERVMDYVPLLTGEDSQAFIAPTELLTTEDYKEEIGTSEYLEMLARLPYLVKRLYQFGQELGIPIISLLISGLSRQEVAAGEADDLVLAVSWLRGVLSKTFPADSAGGTAEYIENEYTTDAIELIHSCEKLGIDLRQENGSKFTKDLIDKMTEYFIKSRKGYVNRKRGGYNRKILQEIRSLSLDIETVPLMASPINEEYSIYNTMTIIEEGRCLSKERETDRFSRLPMTAKEKVDFLVAYAFLTKDISILNKGRLMLRDGYLCAGDGDEFVVFQIEALLPPEKLPCYQGILTETGLLVCISATNTTYFTTIQNLIEYKERLHETGGSRQAGGEILGWEKVVI